MAAHGYGSSAKHTQETESQVITADILQALACTSMEDKEAIANLDSINLTLSQSITQAHETVLVISKRLQALKSQENSKTPTTEKQLLENNTRDAK